MSRRVLVVDDEPEIRAVLGAHLEAEGHVVLEVGTRAEALCRASASDGTERRDGPRRRVHVSHPATVGRAVNRLSTHLVLSNLLVALLGGLSTFLVVRALTPVVSTGRGGWRVAG